MGSFVIYSLENGCKMWLTLVWYNICGTQKFPEKSKILDNYLESSMSKAALISFMFLIYRFSQG